jgi:hypothetical protein
MNYFNFSETSSEPFYKSQKSIKNQNGGFFGLGETDYSELLFDAVRQNNVEALLYLVNSQVIKKINYQDKHGQTILHMVLNNLVTGKNIQKVTIITNAILARPDIKDLINIQDVNGNTALHLAVIAGQDELCDKLIKAGANPLLKNSAGLFIESETETANLNPVQPVQPVQNVVVNEKPITNSESVFISKKELTDTKANNLSDKEQCFINKLIESITGTHKENTSEAQGLTNIETTVVPNIKGGNNFSEYSELINTSEFINDFVSKYQKGGKAKAKKSRKLNTNSQLKLESSMEMPKISQTSALNIDSDDSDKPSSVSEMSELSRMINNQATEIHERTIKKISEILGVGEQEARTIKAFIYNEIKIQHPELNNFDRAVEMEKRITKDNLENLDKKKLKELSDVISEKQKAKSESESTIEEPKVKATKKAKEEKAPKEKKVKETKAKKTKSKDEESSLTSLS